jgi:hypothetical protein
VASVDSEKRLSQVTRVMYGIAVTATVMIGIWVSTVLTIFVLPPRFGPHMPYTVTAADAIAHAVVFLIFSALWIVPWSVWGWPWLARVLGTGRLT